MKRDGEKTRQRILKAAYEQLYKEGFARVSVDAIAEAADVTKKTLYYHFDSKDALAGAVLDHQHEHALKLIHGWADISTEDPARFVSRLFEELGRWASKPRWLGSGYTRITMELADMPGHPARVAARRHKRILETWLGQRFAELKVEEPEEIARRIVLLMEGAMALMLIHGDPGYAKSAGAAALLLIGQRRTGRRRK